EIKDFLRQVMRVTDMIKVENTDPDKLLAKALKDQHERIRWFYKLSIPLIKQYNAYCINKSYLDFNDLLSMTISLFKNKKEILEKYRNKFKYILVDEFQDVNNLQVKLLKLLLKPSSQLFCVGDDWQSIYGFRGSNVEYIVDFKKHFKNARIIKLALNYRSTESIVSASNEIIKNNRYKIDKQLISLKKSGSKIYVFAGENIDDNVEFVVNQIKKLQKEKGYSKEDILVLYRRSKMYAPYYTRLKEEKIFVSGKTIHAAKGLEAKAVFIIGLTEGYGGFPDIWMEDRIYQVIKESKHDLLLEEERRLFYVALTRAKDELFLISEKGNISAFIEEIPDDFIIRTQVPLKSVLEPVKICKNCNSRIKESFEFCPYCGEKQ
ncbi:MAG TPA: ATP-dependent helicase, partial [Bacteroidetes bacterium]|nr:ATP-dependent helicase [Bacteroidota bacterium]